MAKEVDKNEDKEFEKLLITQSDEKRLEAPVIDIWNLIKNSPNQGIPFDMFVKVSDKYEACKNLYYWRKSDILRLKRKLSKFKFLKACFYNSIGWPEGILDKLRKLSQKKIKNLKAEYGLIFNK